MKKLILSIFVVSVIIVIGWFLVKLSSNWNCDSPQKPVSVPQSAVWRGGCDDGNWIDLVNIYQNKYRFRIYRDWDGALEMDADFEAENCFGLIITHLNWKEVVATYLNETMNIGQGKIKCELKPVYPAYGGNQWEIIAEKQKKDKKLKTPINDKN